MKPPDPPLETASAPPPQPIRYLPNGLIDVSNIPPHLWAVVEHNANSPFLRLPAELRNEIYALAYPNQIKIWLTFLSRRRAQGMVPLAYRGCEMSTFEMSTINGVDVYSMRFSVLWLPTVCRQFYVDTALLLYSHAEFTFDVRDRTRYMMMHAWLRNRSAAQRGAIAHCELYAEDWRIIKPDRPPLKVMLPNLKHFGVRSYWAEWLRKADKDMEEAVRRREMML